MILWNILTHKMPSVPVPHRDHHLHLVIKPTTSTSHLSLPVICIRHTHHPRTHPTHTSHTHLSLSTPTITIMTTPCGLLRSKNFLFKPSQQHFVDQTVQYTPVIINAENGNLPVTLSTTVTMKILYPRAVMSKSWRKSKFRPRYILQQGFCRTSWSTHLIQMPCSK